MKRTVFLDAKAVAKINEETSEIRKMLDLLVGLVVKVSFDEGTTYSTGRLQYVSLYDTTRFIFSPEVIDDNRVSFCTLDVFSIDGNIIIFLPLGARA